MPTRDDWLIKHLLALRVGRRSIAHPRLISVLSGMLLILVSTLARSDFLIEEPWEGPRLGQVLSDTRRSEMPQPVYADGKGLPAGSGTAVDGAMLYAERCAACHGSQGQGARAIELVGDRSLLATPYPDKGIAVYWPDAPALFDYVYRSMPPEQPASLTADQVYAVLAHLLVLNGLLDENQRLTPEVLSSIEMPNHAGFRTIGR